MEPPTSSKTQPETLKTPENKPNDEPTQADDDDLDSNTSTENFSSGENVLLDGKSKAKVAYFGPVHFSHDEDWIGIVLEEPIGKHNGIVADTEYFKCDSMHGLFVRSHRLSRLDSLGHVGARVKSPYRLRPKSSSSIRSPDLEIEDMFARADQEEPIGFFEVRAGTLRSPDQPDELNNKLGRVVDEMNDGDGQVNYASARIHSSRTPTPTSQKFSAPSSLSARKMPARKVPGKGSYGISRGFGSELV